MDNIDAPFPLGLLILLLLIVVGVPAVWQVALTAKWIPGLWHGLSAEWRRAFAFWSTALIATGISVLIGGFLDYPLLLVLETLVLVLLLVGRSTAA